MVNIHWWKFKIWKFTILLSVLTHDLKKIIFCRFKLFELLLLFLSRHWPQTGGWYYHCDDMRTLYKVQRLRESAPGNASEVALTRFMYRPICMLGWITAISDAILTLSHIAGAKEIVPCSLRTRTITFVDFSFECVQWALGHHVLYRLHSHRRQYHQLKKVGSKSELQNTHEIQRLVDIDSTWWRRRKST